MPEQLTLNKPADVKHSVFVVEDEALIAMEISDRLTELGYAICGTASRGETALDLICESRPDLVLMDIKLAGAMNGIETAVRLGERYDVPVIYLTAFSDDELLREAARTTPYGYVLKPFNERGLHANIEMALAKRRAEGQVRERDARFRAMVEFSPDSIQILSSTGVILAINPLGVALHEADSANRLVGKEASRWVAPESRPVFEEMIATTAGGDSQTIEIELEGMEGTRRQIEANAVLIPGFTEFEDRSQILVTARDVTARSSIARTAGGQQLQRAEMLASGIAQYLCDQLGFILGSAEMACHDLKPAPGDPVADDLKSIVSVADAAENMLRRLLDFSGCVPPKMESLKLERVVNDALDELEARDPSGTHVWRQIDPHCAPVLGDAGQLRRVLVQLCTNARQALPDGRGWIELHVEQRDPSNAERALWPGFRGGSCLALSVTDDGHGMDETTRERIFESFYSTGDAEERIGLGLAAAKGVIEAHGGIITVQSEPGEGSTFTILLPAERAR